MAQVKNIDPAGLTLDLDMLQHGTRVGVKPGDVIEVPDEALDMLADTQWERVGKPKAKAKQEETT